MTRLQAIALTVIFCVAGCIEGADLDGQESNEQDGPGCVVVGADEYCQAAVFGTPESTTDYVCEPNPYSNLIWITEAGAIWERTCQVVCLSVCE